MKKFNLSQKALADLDEIYDYIAKENPSAALELIEELFEIMRLLAESPMVGHKREDITNKNLRFFTVKKHYMIVYYPDSTPIVINRIISSYRDLKNII